jgi:ribosomal-protein-alanine N-acetyltransferase
MPGGFESVTTAELEQLEIAAMGQNDASGVASWRYPAEYAFYDFVADPEDHADLLNPQHRHDAYFSAHLPACGLIGFVEITPSGDGAVEVGLGLRPECTGRGLGLPFVDRVCSWVTDRTKPNLLVLWVATFNARAIRVYERAGFEHAGAELRDVYGTSTEFLRMTRAARS